MTMVTTREAGTGQPGRAPASASSRLGRAVGQVLREPFGRMGAALLIVLFVCAALTPALADSDSTAIAPTRKLLSPSWWSADPAAPLFGTDHLGRDLGVMAALGVRTSLVIGLSSVALAALVGWVIGGVAGFVGGRVDDIGGRVMDFFSAFPGLLLIIALTTVLGSSMRNVIIVLAIATWDIFGRVARTATLTIRELSFVDAARVSGTSLLRMLLTHVRLSTSTLIGALVAIEIPRIILAESTLSFLGFGLDESHTSLGVLIASERDTLQINPWAVTFSGLVLSWLCVGLSLLGLGIRNVTSGTSPVRMSEAGPAGDDSPDRR